ncbi:serine hydrolase [Marinoscillum sp. MHG1-6]|uniref:serine hydrolase domain-containing protein n=1 Tax=Marinoscillum sp. MHG1-6 TaxID=2959627 RepID=UPI00215804DE|nr:serine hydrolase [Marinoscillum sp. MHG1-6]
MSYKTIILILLFINFQIDSLAQNSRDSLLLHLYSDIDSVITDAISKEAFPGCIIYASQGEKAFFRKAYGFHTYDSLRSVSYSDLYDIASITKVSASTLALMKLYEVGLLDLDKPVREYVDSFGFSKFGKATIREALAHQAGFKGWIKYYEVIKRRNGKYKRKTFLDRQTESYPYKVSDDLYLHVDFYKKLKKYIKKTKVQANPEYVYSGLFFYLVPELVKNVTGMDFQSFLKFNFYDPLGIESLMFNPLEKFEPEEIVPTEIDSFFRKKPLHGEVHDEGAIFMKGVSGNAGQFSRIEDLAKVWHLFINNGIYRGDTLLNAATIDLFTSYQYPALNNRRGLGFDKPLLEYDEVKSSVAKSAGYMSYGHAGYTGTLGWADPDNDLVYIFFSNRVYPSRDHRMIYELNVRPTIHQYFYDFLDLVENCEKISTPKNGSDKAP